MKLTLLTVLLCTAGMLLAVAGCFGGTVIGSLMNDRQEAVTVFFDSLIAGDYTAAYDRVRDYTSLGLENEPSTESGKMVYAALHASYGYELTGSVRTDKLDAAQDVSFTYRSPRLKPLSPRRRRFSSSTLCSSSRQARSMTITTTICPTSPSAPIFRRSSWFWSAPRTITPQRKFRSPSTIRTADGSL